MRLWIPVLSLLLFFGCDFFGVDEKNIDHLASIDSLQVVSVKDLSAKIILYATVPDPCWLYARHTEFRNDREYTYRVYTQRKENSVCPQVLTTLTFPLELWVTSRGAYTLRFHRTASSTLDTIITF